MILDSKERIETFKRRGWWGEKTVADVFDEAVDHRSEELALVDPLNRPDVDGRVHRRLTWGDVDKEVNRLVHVLSDHGIGHSDVFTAQLPNVVELPMMYLAAARLGAVLSPIRMSAGPARVREAISSVESQLHITTDGVDGDAASSVAADLTDELAHLRKVLVLGRSSAFSHDSLDSLDDLLEQAPSHRPARPEGLSADDILTICWSSGTEGIPKGVPRSHNQWFVSAYGTIDAAELTADDILLGPFPVINMAGVGGMLMPWLLTHSRLVLHESFELMAFMKQIAKERVTYTLAPPDVLNHLLARDDVLIRSDLSSLRFIGSGSSPLEPTMVRTWQEDYGIYVINLFGSNEGCTLVSAPGDVPSPEQRARFFPRFGVEGFEWKNRVAGQMKSRLVDLETGEEITEPGRPGELCLWGAAIFPGYWRSPELNRVKFDDEGYYRTGDAFQVAGPGADRRFYEFVGRVQDLESPITLPESA